MSSNDGYISVHYASTNDVYDALLKADTQMGDVLSELEGVINQLMPTWQGISADAWQAIQRGWNDRLTQMNSDLGSNAGILNEMTGNYSTTDNNLAAQWQDITLG